MSLPDGHTYARFTATLAGRTWNGSCGDGPAALQRPGSAAPGHRATVRHEIEMRLRRRRSREGRPCCRRNSQQVPAGLVAVGISATGTDAPWTSASTMPCAISHSRQMIAEGGGSPAPPTRSVAGARHADATRTAPGSSPPSGWPMPNRRRLSTRCDALADKHCRPASPRRAVSPTDRLPAFLCFPPADGVATTSWNVSHAGRPVRKCGELCPPSGGHDE